MLFPLLIATYLCVFFVLVPGLGAFTVRKRWRNFRQTLVSSLSLPLLQPELVGPESGYRGEFRCFGTLEAVEDNDRLWLRLDQSSVSVDLRHESVFVLPANQEPVLGNSPQESVQQMLWDKTGILTEGLGVCVIGSVYMESGIPRFSRRGEKDFMVLMYDGAAQTVLTRALWYGRQRNEYWNDFTPFSLLTGFVALLALSFLGLRDQEHRLAAVFAAGFSLVPFLPLMPPGILCLFLYRRFWRQGRIIRARRDLLQLGQQILASDTIRENCGYHVERTPDGKGFHYTARFPRDPMACDLDVEGDPEILLARTRAHARFKEGLALALLGIGVLGNLYLVLVLVAQLVNGTV